MIETENIDELLSSAESEEIKDYTVFYFEQDSFDWDQIYELGLELDAQAVGREKHSERYFLSLNY